MEMNLPIAYDHSICECDRCELRPQRDRTWVPTLFPSKPWNKLLVLGEGPGVTESRMKIPFVGPAGRVLNGLLEAAGIERDACLIMNTTSCLPVPGAKGEKAFNVVFPNAIPACLPHVLTEIAQWQPRVVLALGSAALLALTGTETEKAVRIRFQCPECGGAGKWMRWTCSACEAEWETPWTDADVTSPCETCGPGTSYKEERGKKCTACNGRVTRVEMQTQYKGEWNISWVAGGVFDAEQLGIVGAKYVIPTYHPSFLMRAQKSRGDKAAGGQFLASAVLEHFIKAKRLLTEDRQWNVKRVTTRDPNVILEYTQYIGPNVWYSLDIETDSAEPHLVTKIKCLGIHRYIAGQGDAEETIVVDTDPDGVDPLEFIHRQQSLFEALGWFLEDPEAQKEGQNFSVYDIDVIERIWGIKTKGLVFDTLLAHRALYPDEPHNLHHIAFTFSDAEPWKPPKNKNGMEVFESKDDLHDYNAKDCVGASLSARILRRRVREEKVDRIHDIDLRKAALAMQMNQFGIPLSLQRREEFGTKALTDREESLAQMREFTGKADFNPHSPKDVPWALFSPDGPCRLIPSKMTDPSPLHPQGQPSTAKGALKKYSDNAFVKMLSRYRRGKHQYDTAMSVALQAWEGHEHYARALALWRPSGAKTGRYTSEPNFQNLSVDLRWMYAVPEGRRICGADSSQLEFRIQAGISGDETMIDLILRADEKRKLEPEYDPHSFVAKHAFGDAYTSLLIKDPNHLKNEICRCQTCQRKALRDVAKRIVYAGMYLGGAPTIREAIMSDPDYDGPDLSVLIVATVLEAFHKAFPRIRPWQQEYYQQAQEAFEVREPLLGRRRVFPFGDVPFTEAGNWPIQSSSSAIIDLATVEFLDRVSAIDPTAAIFAIVHDAIYVETDETKADAVAALLAECMTCDVQFGPGLPTIPFLATGKTGQDWAEVS